MKTAALALEKSSYAADFHAHLWETMLAVHYEPLLRPDDFRLVALLPDERHVPLRLDLMNNVTFSNCPSYEAVSYEWGKAARTPNYVLVQSEPCAIRQNLRNCLRALRDSNETRILWIDSLCINQGSIHERNHQVKIMSKIFRRAKSVLCWLGNASDGSDEFFDTICAGSEGCRPKAQLKSAKSDSRTSMITRASALCQRSYWSRAWIRQELLLAKHIVFYCGNKHAPERLFLIAVNEYQTGVPKSPCLRLIEQRLSMNEGEEILSHSLQQLLEAYGEAQASILCDRVFCLLSLAWDYDQHSGLRPDYRQTPTELSTRVFSFCNPDQTTKFSLVLFKCLGAVPRLPTGVTYQPESFEAILLGYVAEIKEEDYSIVYKRERPPITTVEPDNKKERDEHVEGTTGTGNVLRDFWVEEQKRDKALANVSLAKFTPNVRRIRPPREGHTIYYVSELEVALLFQEDLERGTETLARNGRINRRANELTGISKILTNVKIEEISESGCELVVRIDTDGLHAFLSRFKPANSFMRS